MVKGPGMGREGRGHLGVRLDVSTGSTNQGMGRSLRLRCLELAERSKGFWLGERGLYARESSIIVLYVVPNLYVLNSGGFQGGMTSLGPHESGRLDSGSNPE